MAEHDDTHYVGDPCPGGHDAALALLAPDSPDTWPQGILAVGELREARARAARPGPYVARDGYCEGHEIAAGPHGAVWLYIGDGAQDRADAEHIAAEADPAHALAAVGVWRFAVAVPHHDYCTGREGCSCNRGLLLRRVADDARAYLGGASSVPV